jgi:hypothetical protein
MQVIFDIRNLIEDSPVRISVILQPLEDMYDLNEGIMYTIADKLDVIEDSPSTIVGIPDAVEDNLNAVDKFNRP